jgi:hypothetical protein
VLCLNTHILPRHWHRSHGNITDVKASELKSCETSSTVSVIINSKMTFCPPSHILRLLIFQIKN